MKSLFDINRVIQYGIEQIARQILRQKAVYVAEQKELEDSDDR
ncbi:5155_t:CDS:1, partial [Racocetra persica]